MKIYKNRKDGFKAVQRRSLRILIPLMLFMIIFLWGFALSLDNDNSEQTNTWPYLIILLVGTVALGAFRGLSRQRKIFESYVLTVGEDFIQREQMRTPTIKIKKGEVKEIVKRLNAGITIRGQKNEDLIIVSDQVENLEALESDLKVFGEVKEQELRLATQGWLLLVVTLFFVLAAVVYSSSNKYWVLASGTVLTFGLVWSLYKIQTSKNVDSKIKNGSWWVLAVLFTIIAITCLKVMS